MDANKVDLYLMINGKYFDGSHIQQIRETLLIMDDNRFEQLQMVDYKDPITMLLISMMGGGLGIDRFVIGDIGLGVAKLLTCGGIGIWTIVDWFLIMDRAKEANLDRLRMAIGY